MRSLFSGSVASVARACFQRLCLHAAQRAQVIRVAQLVLLRPAGTVAATTRCDADRQSIYGLLEGPVPNEALARSYCDGVAASCNGMPYVFVPLDGSSIAVTDRRKNKGTG